MKAIKLILAIIKILPKVFWIAVVLPLLAAYKAWKGGNYKV
jgi:hypothetical protein